MKYNKNKTINYKLINFPEVQKYIQEDWFREEAYLCCSIFEEQEDIKSAYFIPEQRIKNK
jgi:hypothetical protein